MSLTLYSGSGSPFAWRVHLALEHKALTYELRMLSFSARDTRKPEFIALNPRHQVPVLVDGDFVLYESNAIVEYLDEAYPGRGAPLFPGDVRQRALVRRLIEEVDNYYYEATSQVLTQAFWKKPDEREADKIAEGRKAVVEESALFTQAMRGDYLAGQLSAADFALYPLVASLWRAEMKLPELDAAGMVSPQLLAWKARIEALPYFDRTFPPHWRQPPA
jgi:glutathione S-transferase